MASYRFSWILRDGGDVDFSWIRDVLVGTIVSFSRKSKEHSSDMDLRGDFYCMRFGWRLGYLDDSSHSPLLVYSVVFYFRGIAHCFSQLHYIYAYLSWIWILSYGT